MRFLFVDRVTEIHGDSVKGFRQFQAEEPLRYLNSKGAMQIAPGAVSEAIGQLASWLCLMRNEFAARPVFLFADRIDVIGEVAPLDSVELTATLHQMDGESLRFSGEAKVQGEIVQRIKDCSGYFMPLADLEDPNVTRERFSALKSPEGLCLSGACGAAFDFPAMAGETLSLDRAKEIRTRVNLAESLPFYADHFPRFPVTPIVMLNEMIGQATARLFGMDQASHLKAETIEQLKIRSFVRPGDICEISVVTEALREQQGQRSIRTVAEIFMDGRRILRGTYQYEVMA